VIECKLNIVCRIVSTRIVSYRIVSDVSINLLMYTYATYAAIAGQWIDFGSY